MNYKAVVNSGGVGSSVEMTEQEDLTKRVWHAHYDSMRHQLRLSVFCAFERKTKRHGWKRTDSFGGWDRRSNTLTEMPLPPIELQRLAVAEWGKISLVAPPPESAPHGRETAA